MTKHPDNILVFRSCGLGDFILSAPGFHLLRKRFPDSRITLLTLQTTDRDTAKKVANYAGGRAAAPWVELLRPHLIDDVIVLDNPRSITAFFHARKILAKTRFDLVIQMIDVGVPWRRRLKKILFAAALVGPKRQLGWRRKGTVEYGKVPATDPLLGHHVFGPMQFAAELDGRDCSSEDVIFDLKPGDDAENWAQHWFKSNVPGGQRLVAFAPGAIHSHKNWPTERFAQLARTILDQNDDVMIVVTGTKSDREKSEVIVRVDPARIKDVCGETSIAQSAALFAHCALVVGNDGGAMHLADAMGAKVVSIVPGLEFPNSIEPWHNIERAIRHPVACAPCYSFTYCPAGHNRCMLDIQLDTVFDQCRKIL
jgi:heptosyltransferase II